MTSVVPNTDFEFCENNNEHFTRKEISSQAQLGKYRCKDDN